MTLAFQCGKWNVEEFLDEMPVGVMSLWEGWFRRRPQGQHHQDRMLSRGFAAIMQSKGADLMPHDFMDGYEPIPDAEELSMDQQCDLALSAIKGEQTNRVAINARDDASHETNG